MPVRQPRDWLVDAARPATRAGAQDQSVVQRRLVTLATTLREMQPAETIALSITPRETRSVAEPVDGTNGAATSAVVIAASAEPL